MRPRAAVVVPLAVVLSAVLDSTAAVADEGWAHYSGNRWLTGLAVALLGTALVLLAVPPGG